MRERKDEKKETKARAENCRWFRVTANTKERDRERDGYKLVHCLCPSEFFVPRILPTPWIQLAAPHQQVEGERTERVETDSSLNC